MFETWFEHDRGRLLAVVSNGTRALIMLVEEPGDPGEHAIDPTGSGQGDGFVLGNGQYDAYSDGDTVPLVQALAIVEHIVDHGDPPAGSLARRPVATSGSPTRIGTRASRMRRSWSPWV